MHYVSEYTSMYLFLILLFHLTIFTSSKLCIIKWTIDISYFYYSFQGLLANEVNGMDLRFNPGGGSGGIKVKGETYMEVLG